jgi:hypothetical protein
MNAIQPTMRVKNFVRCVSGVALCAALLGAGFAAAGPDETSARFKALADAKWQEVLYDPGAGDWQQKWFLDGEAAAVTNTPDGMQLTAGSQFGNDAHHAVLWTKASFEGDLKIEYDYTRLDSERRCVTILYIQATGSGKGPYAKDISKWNELRRVPAMPLYFDHMNTYHISYAAFPNSGKDRTTYIRGRRYMPETGKGLNGTELKPDYNPQDLFAPGVPHHITVIKQGKELWMRVANAEQTYFCRMGSPDLPSVTAGRIGLRHMYTRSARYKNFRVSTLRP